MRLLRPFALALFLLAFMAGNALGAVTWRIGVANWTAEHQLYLALNAAHIRYCGRGLVSKANLITVARWRSKQMGTGGWLGHVIPPLDVHVNYYLRKAGIDFRGWGEIAERGGYAPALSASIAYRDFRNSPPHWAVVTNCALTEVGVGAYRASPVAPHSPILGDITNAHSELVMEYFDVVYLQR